MLQVSCELPWTIQLAFQLPLPLPTDNHLEQVIRNQKILEEEEEDEWFKKSRVSQQNTGTSFFLFQIILLFHNPSQFKAVLFIIVSNYHF